MPRRYKQGADGQPHPAFYGKLPEEFSKADTMRFMVETDLKLSGCVSADTLAALRAEGYDYKDGNLVPAGKEETMQEKVANTTPAAPLKLDVSVRVIEPVKNLMGFASVKFNDCFVVENLKIVQGSKGLFLGMPSQPDGKGGYTLLMNACGGDAARVLREYAYFSPELKAILEKAALMQADRNRTGGMFHAPKSSPWGEVQNCETLCPGVFLVSTASHGGTMVANEVAAVLSPAAKKCGFKDKGYICYEEDAQESVVLRELLDKKLWKIPDRIKDKGQFEEKLNQSIRQYHPEYWRARQSGREAAEAARSTAPAKEAAR